MSCDFEKIWEVYTSSWKAESASDKRLIFEKCLDNGCEYSDPLVKTTGWEELISYMLDFNMQISGGHFVTSYFLAHNYQSIAKWEMRNGEGVVMGEGISYGKYNDNGKLISMSGFFETP